MADTQPIPTHPRFQDLTGKTFGRLTVIGYAGKKRHQSHWLCRCKCGSVKIIRACSIMSGHTVSCGCLHSEVTAKRCTLHGKSKSAEYRHWTSLKERCYCSSTGNYQFYGGRGITVCDRWRDSFENFIADMGPRPSSKHTIDRIDSSGNYEPGNCRWATQDEQQNNKRNSRLIEFHGKTMTISQWARELNLSWKAISSRLARGWSAEMALLSPIRHYSGHRPVSSDSSR